MTPLDKAVLTESERSASLVDFGISPDPENGVKCTGVTSDGSRCPKIIDYQTDRLLCPACKRRYQGGCDD